MARLTFLKRWFTQWTVWEYMPWWAANVPVFAFWLWFSLRARHIFFFSNVNPSIPLGGAVGESKSEILRLLPLAVVPKWILMEPNLPFEKLQDALKNAGIGFPLIAKPDIGERGFLVKKIETPASLQAYLKRWPIPFILQEFLSHPMEASVLFHRFPGESGGFGITSICLKEFMCVRGDGVSSARTLMAEDRRYALQIERFERDFQSVLETIPKSGEEMLLEPIGNHSRGTKFLNGNHLINAEMLSAFESICRNIEDVYYGRFDLKFEDVAALQRGEFKAMELNGILGEPAHIYDPNYGMWRAYKDLWRHWRLLFRLHLAQKRLGIMPTPLTEAWRFVRGYFRYKKQLV